MAMEDALLEIGSDDAVTVDGETLDVDYGLLHRVV